MSSSVTNPILASVDNLQNRVTIRLNQLGCHVRNFWISHYEDELTLHGRVSTEYARNLARYVVLEISGRRTLLNEIRVE